LGGAFEQEKIDAAFLRNERAMPDMAFRLLDEGAFMVICLVTNQFLPRLAIAQGGT